MWFSTAVEARTIWDSGLTGKLNKRRSPFLIKAHMNTLLIQSCSATKHRVENPVPAIDLYDGYFFRIIKKARRADQLDPMLDILILSAKHGIIEPTEEIEYYDQRMNPDHAKEINDDVVETIAKKVATKPYSDVWVNLGKDYYPAVDGLAEVVDIPVTHIDGAGIGVKGKQLKQLVSSTHATPVYGD